MFLQHLFFRSHLSIKAICGPFLDLSTALVLKNFFHSFGCSNVFYENIFYRQSDLRAFYFFGATLLSLESSSFFLFIALNLRLEAPLVNSRLRKNYLHNLAATVYYSLGFALDYLTFPVINLGNSMLSVLSLLEGKLAHYRHFLSFASMNLAFFHLSYSPFLRPFVLLGSSLFHRKDCNYLSLALFSLQDQSFFRTFSLVFLCDFLGKLSFLEVNCSSRFSKASLSALGYNFLLLLGAHGFGQRVPEGSFVVLQSSHKNPLPCVANLLLPVKAHGEQGSYFFNLMGL